MPGRSALIVPITISSRLATLREAGDLMAARGVPAHVTILFPFLPAETLTPDVRSSLERLAADHAPFVARFAHVERRDPMVWLNPLDQRPFLRLTADVAARWPDYPPYGGVHDELIAHLTLIETPDRRARDAACSIALEVGAFDVAVRELTVIVEGASGAWRTRWRLPLGSGLGADEAYDATPGLTRKSTSPAK